MIHICKQLENACENCPGGKSGTLSNQCFNVVVPKGDDAACAKFAADNKCTVDSGGNVCGSLNCMATGCDTAQCAAAQDWGDPGQGPNGGPGCTALASKCPCK